MCLCGFVCRVSDLASLWHEDDSKLVLSSVRYLLKDDGSPRYGISFSSDLGFLVKAFALVCVCVCVSVCVCV